MRFNFIQTIEIAQRGFTYCTKGLCALSGNDCDSQRWLFIEPSPDRVELPIQKPIRSVHFLWSVDRDQHDVLRGK